MTLQTGPSHWFLSQRPRFGAREIVQGLRCLILHLKGPGSYPLHPYGSPSTTSGHSWAQNQDSSEQCKAWFPKEHQQQKINFPSWNLYGDYIIVTWEGLNSPVEVQYPIHSNSKNQASGNHIIQGRVLTLSLTYCCDQELVPVIR